jgi:hypothetical protein
MLPVVRRLDPSDKTEAHRHDHNGAEESHATASLATFRRKNDRLSRFDPAGAATVHCKIVQFPVLKHF